MEELEELNGTNGTVPTYKFIVQDYELKFVIKNDNKGITRFSDGIYSLIITTEAEARLQFGVTGICSCASDWQNFDDKMNAVKGL